MVVTFKDAAKLFGILVVACSAVFVCTLFLSFNIDIVSIKSQLTTEMSLTMYDTLVSMGKIVAIVSGGCLAITSVIMLLFYVKNYIDTHGKQLGILKALGYSNFNISKHFWVFGLSVLIGSVLGFCLAFLYLPHFYAAQNSKGYFPEIAVHFHPVLALLLVVAPAVVFSIIAVLYAWYKLRSPVLSLLKESNNNKAKTPKNRANDAPFLKELRKTTLTGKKTLVFFVAFSAFCFSAMVQMSMSMNELASENFSSMILIIGLVLAFMTMIMSLSSVVKGRAKTIAMMRVFGYDFSDCSKAILGAYRPISYIGFAIGTLYQYGLLKIMMTFVFANVENMPTYSFDFKALIITFIAFIITYELMMYIYSLKIKKLSLKSIMLE